MWPFKKKKKVIRRELDLGPELDPPVKLWRCDICKQRKPMVGMKHGVCADCADADPTLMYLLDLNRDKR